jgi:ubiquinone/menaquinone biosynthesis C-methylase UbiE
MSSYYSKNLSAERLRKIYDLATPRVRQYLEAEYRFVVEQLSQKDHILELGCGYGRIVRELAQSVSRVHGIDSSFESLKAALDYLEECKNTEIACMDASNLAFADNSFDAIICIQNGISAFHVDPIRLIKESLRVVKTGGAAFFSSYAEQFWDDRLVWFEIQSRHGLLGEIDYKKTGNGKIVCKDGFTAITFSPDDFEKLMSKFKNHYEITIVDNLSVFCVVSV